MNLNLIIIIYNTLLMTSVLYAMQPIQPLLANELNISIAKASFLTTITLIPLAIAPIIYGYILEKSNAKEILQKALFILLISQIGITLSSTFEAIIFFRLTSALAIPAVLTSSMSILAKLDSSKIKLNMSIYVASTVAGGLFGRIFSGAISSSFGYKGLFMILAISILIGIVLVSKIEIDTKLQMPKVKLNDILNLLKDKRLFTLYLSVFTLFLSFASILNFLPFRAIELSSEIDEAFIGFLYIGYAVGILSSLISGKISKLFGGDRNTILFGFSLFALSILAFILDSLIAIFISMFFLCFAMFMTHSILSGYANSLIEDKKALTSGLYLASYYLGGAIGSSLPIYELFGWSNLIIFLVSTLFLMILFIFNSKLRD